MRAVLGALVRASVVPCVCDAKTHVQGRSPDHVLLFALGLTLAGVSGDPSRIGRLRTQVGSSSLAVIFVSRPALRSTRYAERMRFVERVRHTMREARCPSSRENEENQFALAYCTRSGVS